MKSKKFLWIVFLIFFLTSMSFVFGFYVYNKRQREAFNEQNSVLYVFRMNDMLETSNSLPLNKSFKVAFDTVKNPQFLLTDNYDKADIMFFETLNSIDANMSKLNGRYPANLRYIFGIKGTDTLVSKSSFAYMMKNTDLVPKTFILNLVQDTHDLQNIKTTNGDIFILKKNIQRQQGIYITDNISNILQKKRDDDEFVIAQIMLQDPFLIDNRKINMRIYLFIHIDNRNIQHWYIYDDGFLYYTPNSFKKNTLNTDQCITSGYIDRSVYEKNPMTIKDFLSYLNKIKHYQYKNSFYSKLQFMFSIVKKQYTPIFYENNKDIPGEKALVYGCDIAPDSKLNLKFMEINKGPDLNFKDERDKKVKLNLVFHILMKMNIVSKDFPVSNNLISIK